MDTIPVTLDDVYAGFADAEGLLRNETTHLCLEYQVKDGILGVLKSEVHELRIPMENVASVILTKGWLGTKWFGVKLIIQADRMETFEDVPGASHGRLKLKISRQYREAAEDFVYNLHRSGKVPGDGSYV
jgi:hypothetical protein